MESKLQAQLPPLLSVIAGTVDVLGYLLLGHVFTAHITGNLVLVAASVARGGPWSPAQVLTMPTFIVALGAVWGYASISRSRRVQLAHQLLLIQAFLLASVFVLAVTFHVSLHQHSWIAVVTAMVAVSAMATQYALFRLAMPRTVSTAVMTGNLTTVTLSLIDEVPKRRRLIDYDPDRVTTSLRLLLGFFLGCVAAAAAIPMLGDWASILPVLLSVAAIVLVAAINRSSQTLEKGTNQTWQQQ